MISTASTDMPNGVAVVLLMSLVTIASARNIMGAEGRTVATSRELVAVATDPAVVDIVVADTLTELPTFRLSPGKKLRGVSPKATLRFAVGQDGVQLSTDNQVESLAIETDVDRRALFNDTTV